MADNLIRLLVVEDDKDDFLILQKMLTSVKHGRFEVDRASTYAEGLKKLKENRHHLCILDYRLEGRTGLDFLKEATQNGHAMPVIFLTGQGDYEVDVEAMQLGAADFLYKNKIDSQALEKSIRYVLERLKSQENLRQREEFYREIIDNSLGGVAIVEPAGIRYLSQSAARILGYSLEEIKQSGISLIHPQDQPRIKEVFDRIFKTQELVQDFHIRVRPKNGIWRVLELFVKNSMNVKPIQGVVVNFHDVTEQYEARETAARLANIIENSNDAIVACDLDGLITHWNRGAEGVYGYTEKEVLGMPVTMLLADENQDENRRQIEIVKQGGSLSHYESVRKKKGGQMVDVSISISPYKNAEGKIVGLSAIVRDITEQKKTLETLSRLAAIVESSNDAIYSVTLDGILLSWNPGAQKIYGYAPEEIVGRNLSLIVPDWREGEFHRRLNALQEGKTSAQFTTLHRAKGGKEVLLSISLSSIKDSMGRVHRASVIGRDITAGEKAKAVTHALQDERDELLERFQLQMESMPIACILTDEKFNYTYWNPAAEKMFGYSFHEVEGRMGVLVSPQDMENMGKKMRDQTLKGETFRNVQLKTLCKDGKTLTCEWYGTPLRDKEGHFTGMIAMAIDVTERTKAEAVQFQLAAILQQTPDAVIGSDLDGNIFGWNPGAEAMFGYTFEEVIGKPVSLLAPPDREHEQNEMREIALGGEIISNLESVRVRKNGDSIDVSITLFPMKDASGRITGISAILRDVSERKRAEESLKRHEERMRLAEKMNAIGRLAGGVAHDFNNLLSVIGGNAEFLMSELAKDNPSREELEEIQKAVRRGADLTKQLLVFGQKQVSQPQPVNLNDMGIEMNKMFKRVLDASIELSIIQEKALNPILADPGQIQQVILNLVLNARDAMPNGGHLIIETKNIPTAELALEEKPALPSGSYVRLAVTDTGTGMSPEIQKRVFEPFFTTKANKGTGLGLATVYGIVTKWSGHVFLHSTPGMGTTFTLYFPALPVGEAAAAGPKQIALIPQGSETLLVAEDEEPVRKVLVRTMEKYGYRVLEAKNGLEAVQKAWGYGEPIHLLLTDAMMPKMNGRELAQEVRKTRPKIKVIFVSGYPREVLSEQGILDSSIHLIQKPFDLEDLARQVRKVLDEK